MKRHRSDSTESTRDVCSEDIHTAKHQRVDDSEASDRQELDASMVFDGPRNFGRGRY